MLGCARRGESIFITDPKAELWEKMSDYFKDHGYCVRAVNFLDMAHSDGWNCLYSLDQETQLVQTVANTIIQNTSGPKEADDFWSRAELNLLMALIHYICNLKGANGKLLPIEQRGLGDVYQLLANKSIQEINRTLAQLPPEHPGLQHELSGSGAEPQPVAGKVPRQGVGESAGYLRPDPLHGLQRSDLGGVHFQEVR